MNIKTRLHKNRWSCFSFLHFTRCYQFSSKCLMNRLWKWGFMNSAFPGWDWPTCHLNSLSQMLSAWTIKKNTHPKSDCQIPKRQAVKIVGVFREFAQLKIVITFCDPLSPLLGAGAPQSHLAVGSAVISDGLCGLAGNWLGGGQRGRELRGVAWCHRRGKGPKVHHWKRGTVSR